MITYKQKSIDHLGLVSGICDEIGLKDTIDSNIQKPKRKVSVGQAVQSMIINALGFSNRAMYLHPEFYRKKPVNILIGKDLTPEDLNEDCLSSALDSLYNYGLTELFYKISTKALKKYKIKHRFVHLDSTSFSLHGKYDFEDEASDTEIVTITKGYSKDNNPDLNQVIVSLMCSYRTSIPVWIEALSGNSSDKKEFPKTIKKFKKNFQEKELPYFVADSELYTTAGLNQLTGIKWVTRVPETLKLAKKVIQTTEKSQMNKSTNPGYYFKEIESEYADIKQRWLIVFSEKAYEKEYSTLCKNINKENEKKGKELWHLGNKMFACEADAVKAVSAFNRKLRYHQVKYSIELRNHFEKKGRPEKNKKPQLQEWYISGFLVIDSEAVGKAQSRKGFFIIATNELDRLKLSEEQLLDVYKGQNVSVERGFRFLKDPMFYAESLYLKLPKRIMALIMVMGLSLLVYSLAEKKLRTVLAVKNITVKDQKRRPTKSPTIRWVFQKFQDVLMLFIYESNCLKRIQCELTEDQENIIHCLGKHVEKMYIFDL